MAEMKRSAAYYSYGNAAVRSTQAPVKEQPRKTRREEYEYLKQTELQIHENTVKLNKEARLLTPLQMVLVMAALCIIFGLSGAFIRNVSVNHQLKRNITSMTLAYEETVKNNQILENEIEKDLDLPGIYAYATEVLKMQIPEKNQVICYNDNALEYVSVHGDIPNE